MRRKTYQLSISTEKPELPVLKENAGKAQTTKTDARYSDILTICFIHIRVFPLRPGSAISI